MDAAAKPTADPEQLWDELEANRLRVIAAMRFLRPTDSDVEDYVHDAMIEIVAGRREVDLGRVGGLLRVVATRRAIDADRRLVRRQRLLGRLWSDDLASPEDLASDRILAAQSAAAMRDLPSRQGEAILQHAEGWLPRETASRLGVPANVVRIAASRARTAIKAAVGPLGGLAGWRWLRRLRPIHVGPALAVVGVGAMIACTSAPHASDGVAGRRPPGGMRTTSQSTTVVLPPSPAQPAARSRPHGSQTSAVGRPSAVIPGANIWVGTKGTGADAGTGQTHPTESFTQSLENCLTGGISLDPQHAGCKSAY